MYPTPLTADFDYGHPSSPSLAATLADPACRPVTARVRPDLPDPLDYTRLLFTLVSHVTCQSARHHTRVEPLHSHPEWVEWTDVQRTARGQGTASKEASLCFVSESQRRASRVERLLFTLVSHVTCQSARHHTRVEPLHSHPEWVESSALLHVDCAVLQPVVIHPVHHLLPPLLIPPADQ
jgi:hypothetical protein